MSKIHQSTAYPRPLDRVAWSVSAWAAAVSCSRMHVYRLIKRNELRTKLMGRKRLILTSPREYVENLDEGPVLRAVTSLRFRR